MGNIRKFDIPPEKISEIIATISEPCNSQMTPEFAYLIMGIPELIQLGQPGDRDYPQNYHRVCQERGILPHTTLTFHQGRGNPQTPQLSIEYFYPPEELTPVFIRGGKPSNLAFFAEHDFWKTFTESHETALKSGYSPTNLVLCYVQSPDSANPDEKLAYFRQVYSCLFKEEAPLILIEPQKYDKRGLERLVARTKPYKREETF